jgi:hypothetical protein
MNPTTIAIFDSQARFRAVLSWNDGVFIPEDITGFHNDDIKTFLAGLANHDPRQRLERDYKTFLAPAPQDSPGYQNAVWQELGIQGFIAYPIEGYQKAFLVQLNDAKFDMIREKMVGDLLSLSKDEIPGFIADLKEGVDIIEELRKLA